MNRLERLVNLLAALIDTERPLPREEIHERVPGYPERDESFRRQFERDKETLRRMNIPVQVEPISASEPWLGTGYRVRRSEYELADPQLDAEEMMALHLATSSIRFLDEGARAAVVKLGGAPTDGSEQKEGETGGPMAGVEVPGAEHLETCFAAINSGGRLTFTYKGENRRVVPVRLAFRSGRWYLAAWDETRGDERLFRLDRLESAPSEVADKAPIPAEAARVQRGLPAAAWELGDTEPVDAQVWVDSHQADMAVRLAGPAARVERRDDGGAVLTLQVRNPAGFRNFVLGFLDHAVVLSPKELREDAEQWLRSIAAGHEV